MRFLFAFLWNLAFASAGLTTLIGQRKVLMFNCASTRRTHSTAMLLLMCMLVASFRLAKGTPAATSVQTMAICHASVAAVLGAAFSWILFTGLPVLTLLALAFELRPDHPYFGYGVYILAPGVVNRTEVLLARRGHVAKRAATDGRGGTG